MTTATQLLPPEITVFERGWLCANNILFIGAQETALVDTGYHTEADETVRLVQQALGGRALDRVLNTHLHSDHSGGNAALQAHWPQVRTAIPPDQIAQVRNWDPIALSYEPTGQDCPPFRADEVLEPGDTTTLGGRIWQIHSAPGHDPHAIVLFEPDSRTLISGDALWENGFGVIFPELAGQSGFDDTARTLELIADLNPLIVIPGHGKVFVDVPEALQRARSRLAAFQAEPIKHAQHAARVLLKYKMIEWRSRSVEEAWNWITQTSYCQQVHSRFFPHENMRAWFDALVQSLVKSGALRLAGGTLYDV